MDNFLEKQLVGYAVIEDNSYVDKRVKIRGFFAIGNHSSVQADCWINNALIGNYSRIDKRVQLGYSLLYTEAFSNHYFSFAEGKNYFKDVGFSNLSTNRFFYQKTPISYIGNDVRVCDNCIVYAGVNIGDGAVIYPNSVVTNDVEPYAIVAGNPAVKIGDRFDTYTKQRIINLDWTSKDYSKINPLKRINYLDIDYILNLFEAMDFEDLDNNEKYLNSYLNEFVSVKSKVAIIGPSHVHNWMKLINDKKIKRNGCVFYGEPGLSLFSNSINNFIKWWVNIKKRKVVFMIPDFRIGNSDFINSIDNKKGNGVFIYKENMSRQVDAYISSIVIEYLSCLVDKYKENITFVFWSLFAREQMNIKANKYLIEGKYQHPYWNYEDFITRFSKNTIDISEIKNSILSLIEQDGTTHPTIEGYSYLQKKINVKFEEIE